MAIWTPSEVAVEQAQVTDFARFVGQEPGDYAALQNWSINELDQFWQAFADWGGVRWHQAPTAVFGANGQHMPGTEWFPGSQLNYAEHALAAAAERPDDVAVVAVLENGARQQLSWGELADQVRRCRAGLVALGVGRGDRVVGYLPNVAESVVALLATASIGAVWASCPPEFGTRAVIDRFSQIEPVVLLAVDGYHYKGKPIERADEVARLIDELPTVRHTIHLEHLARSGPEAPSAIASAGPGWEALLAPTDEAMSFESVPFNHPLYVLSSSGTTGLPKPIVHGHGGITLEHLKIHRLHHDLGPDDRFFWFSTTGWMMWNYLVSGLAVGSTIVLYDGDPATPGIERLWQLAADEAVTVFGASAPFAMACRKAGLEPGRQFDLSALRSINSTGAPLPAAGFEWKVEAVSATAQPVSVSGGTDVCSAFVGMSPIVPVEAGLLSVAHLGCAVAAFDEDGRRRPDGETGELVITKPMPSMPVGFWNDDDGRRYRAAYFERYPGVWCHGDWITFFPDGGCEISGRSDATLNRGGVRIGTSDLYRCVEELPEVADSLVVHVEGQGDDASGPGTLVLFVALIDGDDGPRTLTDELSGAIRRTLRSELSPRHVPDEIVAIRAVPRTLSGKKLEVPVKRMVRGEAATEVAALDSLADPAALLELEQVIRSR
jgi:acetoacetyl-CoA synthetase